MSARSCPWRPWPALLLLAAWLGAPETGVAATVDDLVRAYPDALWGTEGTNLVWRDGTRMPLGPVRPGGTAEDVLEHATILDQLATTYPAGAPILPPDGDPGRVRNRAFFDKMYGDCRRSEVEARLVRIVWLPRTWGHTVSITSVNGVDRQLEAISRELDELPARFQPYLFPLGGTYKCRTVAGTDQTSMHSWGVAIDLNTRFSDYWRWSGGRSGEDPPPFRNRMPPEIVAVFERHGFIWGGRWSHFDTMHFEYRPELFGSRPLPRE